MNHPEHHDKHSSAPSHPTTATSFKHTNKLLWILLGIAVLLGIIWQWNPLENASKRLESLPLYNKNVAGRNIPLTDLETSWFQSVDVIKRIYQVGDQHLFITVLDGTNNRHVVHDPLYCFRGGGWEVVSQTKIPLEHGEGMLLSLTQKDKNIEALYWFSDGVHQFTSPTRYWLDTTMRRLTLGRWGNEPVLVLVQPIDSATLDTHSLFRLFPELEKL